MKAMPRVDDADRVRAKRPKTRKGCRTCKARRVRCDEAKPFCRNCTSKCRKCGGYEGMYDNHKETLTNSAPQLVLTASTQEAQAVKYFQYRTCSQIAGFYQNEPWTRIVMQLILTDSCVRHAAIALASLHRRFEETGSMCTSLDVFGYEQYSTAVREHAVSLCNPGYELRKLGTYLTSCILFICIELIQFHYHSAASLIRQGVQLLRGLLARKDEVPGWPLEVYERFISRLQAQAVAIVPSQLHGDAHPPRMNRTRMPSMPLVFEDVRQARDYFERYRTWYDSTHWRVEPPQGFAKAQLDIIASYREVMARYSFALNSLQQLSQQSSLEYAQPALLLLRMRALFLTTSLDIAIAYSTFDDRQDAWDLHTESFREIVTLCESVLKAVRTGPHSHRLNQRYSLTLDSGIVAPLSDVARLCRDPMIRRKAIWLLRQYPSREGLADSLLSARVCERVMELEEEGVSGKVICAADILPVHRVRKVRPQYYENGRGVKISYYRNGLPDWFQENYALGVDISN